jgi:hypothetical protein
MAIQFPPITASDPAPIDGEIYLYVSTGEEFQYDVTINAWTPLGKTTGTVFQYSGILFIKDPAPRANLGYIYSVADGADKADIDASFVGLAGIYDVEQWAMIVYDGTRWSIVNNNSASGPWIRTGTGQIQPTVDTDALNMVNGDYVLETLNDLP